MKGFGRDGREGGNVFHYLLTSGTSCNVRMPSTEKEQNFTRTSPKTQQNNSVTSFSQI